MIVEAQVETAIKTALVDALATASQTCTVRANLVDDSGVEDTEKVIRPVISIVSAPYYVGFSVPFALAIAAVRGGRLDAAWARWSRPWTNVAWGFLSLGIMLGSWWAYYELGWGGWWFWDPVENASFMPWLVGTALVHSLAVTEKRGLFASWTVLLAIAAVLPSTSMYSRAPLQVPAWLRVVHHVTM